MYIKFTILICVYFTHHFRMYITPKTLKIHNICYYYVTYLYLTHTYTLAKSLYVGLYYAYYFDLCVNYA